MITLVASTVAKLAIKASRPRYMLISSDSTTVTRIALASVGLEVAGTGFGVTAYSPLKVFLPAGQELYAISTGTPNISIAEVQNATDVVELR